MLSSAEQGAGKWDQLASMAVFIILERVHVEGMYVPYLQNCGDFLRNTLFFDGSLERFTDSFW